MTTTLPLAKAITLRRRLLDWFTVNARPLPWRLGGYPPYQVWISEVMLQQTQMERGVLFFERWIQRFPGIGEVAGASEEEILKLWEGLGYYSRARNIHALARQVMKDHGGKLPDTLPALLALPGIGRYTARAILSLAFQQDYPVVDGNVERLFARLFAIDEPVKSSATRSRIWALAEMLLPPGQARHWNQALMEFGALVCGRGTPCCGLCPVTTECLSFQEGATPRRPVVAAVQKGIPLTMIAAVIVNDQGQIFVRQRGTGSRWAKLWEFPGGTLPPGGDPARAVVPEVRTETGLMIAVQAPLPIVTHAFTKYRATLHPFLCRLTNDPAPGSTLPIGRWISLADLNDLAFSAGHRQVITALGSALDAIGSLPRG